MKKLLIFVFCLLSISICANADPSDNNKPSVVPNTLLKNTYRHIVDVIPGEEETFVVVMLAQPTPGNDLLRVMICNVTGQILSASEFAIHHFSFVSSTNDPDMSVLWLSSTSRTDTQELWLAEWDGRQFQPRLLLKQGRNDPLLRKCWLFEVHGKKKLFVETFEPKQIRIKGDLNWINTRWLYCYGFAKDGLKLESKKLVAEGKTKSDEYSVECALIDGEVYIWVCKEGGQWSAGGLRVAKWSKDEEFKWIECYRGNKGSLLRGLTVDRLHGAAAIFEWKKGQWVSSAIICQIQDSSARWVNLGLGFGGKNQLARGYEDGVYWLLSGYKGRGIVVLNNEFQRIREMPPTRRFSHITDYHLVSGSDQKVYIATVTEDGHFKIEKLEDFVLTKPIPQKVEQRDLEELSKQRIETVYNEYIEGEGKHLLKATDDQLAKDIVSGSRESISPLISYYRLLLRDEKRAKKCISKQVRAIVKEGAGHEHWLTEMELLLYGDLVIEPLLIMADKGTAEERQITVGVLQLIPDPTVSNKLVGLLDRDDIRKDSITTIAISEIGIESGNPKAIDFLIDAATGKFIIDEDFESRQLKDKSRQSLIEIFTEYKDVPEDWSARKWEEWWEKYQDTWESPKTLTNVGYRKSKVAQEMYREIARLLESGCK